MSQRRTYFLVPGNDYAPNELIQLGQIISDLKLPYRRLSPPLQPLPKVYNAWEKDYGAEKNKVLSGSIGIFAQALAVLDGGVGGDVAGKLSAEKLNRWKFEKLETEFIEPDEAYVNESVRVKVVEDFLDKNKVLKKAVYMVTGVKIARGPQAMLTQAKHEVAGEGKLTLDATAATGVPVQGGPQLSLARKKEDLEWFGSSSDFVFAYRLRKIFVTWSSRIDSKELTGGDLQGYGDNDIHDSDEEEQDEVIEYIQTARLDRCDLGSNYLPERFRKVVVRDDVDDAECQVLWLQGD
jgi:hypothetical protein